MPMHRFTVKLLGAISQLHAAGAYSRRLAHFTRGFIFVTCSLYDDYHYYVILKAGADDYIRCLY